MTTQEQLYESIWEFLKPSEIEGNEQEYEIGKVCCENPEKILDDKSFMVCSNCGTILEQVLDDNKNYNYTNNDGEKSGGNKDSDRCGTFINPLIPSMCMNSNIIPGNSNISKIQKWLNNSAISYSEKTLLKLKYKISDIIASHNISGDICTLILYKIKELIKLKEEKCIIHRGKIYTGIISACFYYTSKENGYNISPIVVTEMFEIDIKTFNKCCDIYTEITANNNSNIITKDNSLIIRFFGDLGITYKITTLGIKIMKSADELYITQGISPQSNISGLIEFLNIKLELKIDIEKICEITKAKASTVKKVSKMYLDNQIKIYNYMKFYM
jgi:transcription initiation factor TFIIIB Brf1 subunit/transcription initiation factor TFIIB